MDGFGRRWVDRGVENVVRNRDLDESGSRFAVGMVGICDFEGVVGGR